jgi:hypothetical protein
MSQRTLRRLVLATLLLFMGGVSAQADDQIFTVRIENVSARDALKLSNGKTEPVGVAPVLYVVHTNRAPLFTSGDGVVHPILGGLHLRYRKRLVFGKRQHGC